MPGPTDLTYWPRDGRQEFFLNMVDLVASRSGDSTKVGFVLTALDHVVLSVGWNDLPRKVKNTPDRRKRPPEGTKYKFTEHAERNAIYNAARHGTPTRNSIGYMRWFPCCDCARCLIQAGVTTLFSGVPNWDDPTWGPDFLISYQMFKEADVQMRFAPPAA